MGTKTKSPNMVEKNDHDRCNLKSNKTRHKTDKKAEEKEKNASSSAIPQQDEYEQNPLWLKSNLKIIIAGALFCGVINMLHTSSLFENDRHFSHLSNLEREMTFRTEMGFYYSHYKTVVEAPSFVSGLTQLMHNNITEYPSIVNSLQRFNIIPEVVIGGMYRCFAAFSKWAQLELDICWRVTRGNDLSAVYSCEGIGVPANFYVWCTWWMAGLTAAFIFVSGATLSRSAVGGLLSALCFFFNHGEATRVMWAPPLRETFAFPFSLLINIVVTEILRNPRAHYSQPLFMAVASYAYLVTWQFSQYTLMITMMVVYLLHTIELIRPLPMILVLTGTIFGFANSLVTLFANRMLMTSYLAGCLLALFLMYCTLENVFNWLPPPMNKTTQASFIILSTIAGKMELSNLVGVEEDSHVFNIMRAKFTNYSDFHTLLYTCSGEFDFLPMVSVVQLSKTLLIPFTAMVFGAVFVHMTVKVKNSLIECLNKEKTLLMQTLWRGIDPGVIYNMIMLVVYCVLSALIMRLKLFMTPQLCIIASLITCPQYFKFLQKRELYYGVMVIVIAAMSIRGTENILSQRSTRGEYLNPRLEELLEWVGSETTTNSVFAGTMPTMANLMLSTRRPIVNHPHYETAESRRRTKEVYTVFSRRSPKQVYDTLRELKVNYLVLDENWCLHRYKPGCGMVDIWDIEEPQNINKSPLCPKLYYKTPTPFRRVFANEGYVVLQVPSNYVQIPPPKSLKS